MTLFFFIPFQMTLFVNYAIDNNNNNKKLFEMN